jgi:putative oxidoreductase
MFRKIMATWPNWVTVPIRLGLGSVMTAHGAQKVLGMFGGPGFEKFVSNPTPFGFMKPTWLWLGAAALSELVGGGLIVLGLLTRVGAFFVACTMLTAVVGVHWGSFFAPKGMEYPLALFSMALALLISGGGMASIDLALSRGSTSKGSTYRRR